MSVRRSGARPEAGPGRAVWVAIILIASVMIAIVAGVLEWISGDKIVNAILAGGTAFGASALLIVTLIRFGSGEGT